MSQEGLITSNDWLTVNMKFDFLIKLRWNIKYSEEAYQSILTYVINSVRIVNDPGIKRLYIQAARQKFSIEYSCEDIST